ncbi:hypothetical protein CHS0354_002783 [Potamilus streckersoni]|uniref:Large ribosomal subunit protein mL54 n=1 Tax=Potamilus streckersoni TaxID=2493646 RepID=A0AAE0SNN0_9BIVA|nr:hypothetical protein CHS0354_002783 [Potamilus streckersoni]
MASTRIRILCKQTSFVVNFSKLLRRLVHQTASCDAKKLGGAGGKAVAPVAKKELEVEQDPQKLCRLLCGGNIFKEGSDPELKPDNEYPDWLWTMRLDRQAIPLSELDPETPQYWNRLKTLNMRRQKRLQSLKKF